MESRSIFEKILKDNGIFGKSENFWTFSIFFMCNAIRITFHILFCIKMRFRPAPKIFGKMHNNLGKCM